MEFLTRAELLKKRAPRTVDVDLPELGGKVRIRALTEGERSRYEASFLDKEGKVKLTSAEAARRKLVAESAVDASGNKLLTEADVAALANVDAAAVDRLYDEARKLSGFTQRDLEELLGNSSAPSADDSVSA